MDVHVLADLARALGGEQVRVSRTGKVQTTCLLARWNHLGGRDAKPSMVLMPEGKHGDPIFTCLGCHERGAVRDLVLLHWAYGRKVQHWVDVLDGDGDAAKPKSLKERYSSLRDPDEVVAEKGAKGIAFLAEHRRREERHKAEENGEFQVPFAPTVQQNVVKAVREDGKPWYDFQCLAKADQVKEIPWGTYNPYVGKVPRYAIERGLTLDTCREWQLGYDKAMKRLLFPIKDRKGRLVGISGRLVTKDCVYCGGPVIRDEKDERGKKVRPYCARCARNEPPKYLHSDGFERNLVVYGEHRRQDNIDGHVYVVEGNLDMLLMWQAMYRPVVAIFGSYPGEAQIEKLIAYWGRRITVVHDGDKAGEIMAAKVKEMVADRVPVSVRGCPDRQDPGSLVQAGTIHELLGPPPAKAA